MEIVDKFLAKVGTDKLLHISVSMILTLELRRLMPLCVAALIVLGIGISKEIYDKVSQKGTPDWKDILADCVGIALGCL